MTLRVKQTTTVHTAQIFAEIEWIQIWDPFMYERMIKIHVWISLEARPRKQGQGISWFNMSKNFNLIKAELLWCSGYHVSLTHWRSPVRSWAATINFFYSDVQQLLPLVVQVRARGRARARGNRGYSAPCLDESSTNSATKKSSMHKMYEVLNRVYL